MFEHDNTSFSSINSDELRWLNAYNTILQEPSPSSSPAIDIPRSSSPSPIPLAVNDSLTLLRSKEMQKRRHRYQASTKSSSSKDVKVPDSGNDRFKRGPLHPNLRCIITPPTPTPTPPPESPKRAGMPTTPNLLHSHQVGAKRRRKTSMKNGPYRQCKARPSVSPTSPLSSSASSPSNQEWIYRVPKPSSSPSSSTTSFAHMTSMTPPRRTTAMATREEEMCALDWLESAVEPSSPPKSTPFWSNLLRSRGRSGSESAAKSSSPSSHLRAKPSVVQQKTKPADLWFSRSPSPPVPPPKPLISHPLPVHSRSSSMTSTASTLSTATSSSHPQTPTSPALPIALRRKTPLHEEFDVFTDSSSTITKQPCKSILTRSASSRSTTVPRPAVRKNSLATITSSNKSVKFVEAPTVHYPSAGYWDCELREEDEVEEVMDLDLDDISGHEDEIFSESRGYSPDDVSMDGGSSRSGTPMSFVSDRDERGRQKTTGTSLSSRFPSLRRKHASLSPSAGRSGRPAISGPFALGSLPFTSNTPTSSPPSLAIHTLSAKGTTDSSPLRSRTSSESLRSTRSGGAKSTRSVKSLRSLSGSVKSGMSLGAIRDWFRKAGPIDVSS